MRRAVLVLAVVFGIFATVGWTAVRSDPQELGPREAALAAWQRAGLPPVSAAPESIGRWFAALPPARAERITARFPLVVGNLDGAPLDLRYRANRRAIGQELVRERAQLRRGGMTDRGRTQTEKRLAVLTALRQPDRQVLAFDPTGRGQVAEVRGDLARAERVAVVVPGVDTKLSNFERFADDDKPGYVAPAGMAASLYDEVRADSPGQRVAVIAWADYEAPAGLGVDAATGLPAEAGAVRLTRLVSALPSHPGTALICHSYGSVVCGLAAPALPGNVTDIAVAGSPGMRASDADALHTRARIWATRASGDWIADVPHFELAGLGHGADPVDDDFGARVFPAGGAHGHTEYFRPGTGSLRTFAAIATGSALQRA
ncbi:alpha/beta hydrolase [Streptomyces sp. NPDC051940]|uniref:alpha/beta hydrolase n=1 Tax=Streptomyces sp. NPDC051940 TaxID=3155675 RepID=UPI003438C9D4